MGSETPDFSGIQINTQSSPAPQASPTGGFPNVESPTGATPNLGPTMPRVVSRSTIAQAQRLKHIQTAKGWLIFLGCMTIAFSLFSWVTSEKDVEDALAEGLREASRYGTVDPALIEKARVEALGAVRVALALNLALGAAFIGLALFIRKAPIPVTATALILYIAVIAILAVQDLTTLAQGWLIKFIIISSLVTALKAAIAFDRDRRLTGATG